MQIQFKYNFSFVRNICVYFACLFVCQKNGIPSYYSCWANVVPSQQGVFDSIYSITQYTLFWCPVLHPLHFLPWVPLPIRVFPVYSSSILPVCSLPLFCFRLCHQWQSQPALNRPCHSVSYPPLSQPEVLEPVFSFGPCCISGTLAVLSCVNLPIHCTLGIWTFELPMKIWSKAAVPSSSGWPHLASYSPALWHSVFAN